MTEDRRHLELPDRRKNTYADLEKRVDEHAEHVEDRLRSFFLKALIAMAVIGVTSAIGLFGFAYVLGQVKDTRKDFVRQNCTAQNKRHTDTVTAFHKAADEATAKHPEQAAAIQESVDANLAIIAALAPVQDCDYLVKLSVGDVTPTPVPEKTP
jgi:hypothetical protein